MKGTKDYYNKSAFEWAEKWYENEMLLPCLKEFMSLFEDRPRILDLCCGAGYESQRMQKLGGDIIGIDFSENSIDIAKERNRGIEFYVDNMLNDYSYIGKVDGITVIAGLIHLENHELSTAFESMSKVLKDDGYALLVVLDGEGKQNQLSYVNIDEEEYDRNFVAHTLNELIENSKGILEYQREMLPDPEDTWKRYLFKKDSSSNSKT
jgi:SAM-dependent methyltransferase